MTSNEIVYGSLGYMEQQGRTLAESFLSVEAIILIDISASMQATDALNGQMRHTVACDELRRLQRQIPGKIAVIEWATGHAFVPGGAPSAPNGSSTNMAGVLRFVKIADGTDIKLILISDGEPDSEQETLAVARDFKSKIDTIYIGPEGGPGADFLRRLAALTGGRSDTKSAREIVSLSNSITKLLSSSL
jgi:hypothetical protein